MLPGMETLTVREAAAFTGLSAHTLRYYERAGLLEPIARNANGHRRYVRGDLERLQFLHCLRETGMPIRRMQEYAALTREGQATLDVRIELLASYRNDVRARITELEHSLQIIDAKIDRLQHSSQDGASAQSACPDCLSGQALDAAERLTTGKATR